MLDERMNLSIIALLIIFAFNVLNANNVCGLFLINNYSHNTKGHTYTHERERRSQFKLVLSLGNPNWTARFVVCYLYCTISMFSNRSHARVLQPFFESPTTSCKSFENVRLVVHYNSHATNCATNRLHNNAVLPQLAPSERTEFVVWILDLFLQGK